MTDDQKNLMDEIHQRMEDAMKFFHHELWKYTHYPPTNFGFEDDPEVKELRRLFELESPK